MVNKITQKDWSDCMGCDAINKRHLCIGDYDDLFDICPCRNCIVKMMCNEACEEYNKLRDTVFTGPGN